MKRFAILIAILFSALPVIAQSDGPSVSSTPRALQDYVDSSDDAFHWKRVNTTSFDAGRVYELRLSSQRWHDILWEHAIEIYEPANLQFPGHALLFVTGGSKPGPPGKEDIQMGLKLASTCGARVVMLHQTPNQPLLGNRKEDDLITETWLRYLNTGEIGRAHV